MTQRNQVFDFDLGRGGIAKRENKLDAEPEGRIRNDRERQACGQADGRAQSPVDEKGEKRPGSRQRRRRSIRERQSGDGRLAALGAGQAQRLKTGPVLPDVPAENESGRPETQCRNARESTHIHAAIVP